MMTVTYPSAVNEPMLQGVEAYYVLVSRSPAMSVPASGTVEDTYTGLGGDSSAKVSESSESAALGNLAMEDMPAQGKELPTESVPAINMFAAITVGADEEHAQSGDSNTGGMVTSPILQGNINEKVIDEPIINSPTSPGKFYIICA